MDNGTAIFLIALAIALVALIGFSSYRMVSSATEEMRRKMTERPAEPVPMVVRCEATIPLGWPLALPAQCWRKAGHELFSVKHYAKKGDGTNFIVEWR